MEDSILCVADGQPGMLTVRYRHSKALRRADCQINEGACGSDQ